MNIREGLIKSVASNQDVYQTGLRYFKEKAVEDLHYDREARMISAKVLDNEFYNTSIKIDQSGQDISFYCSCKAFLDCSGACQHIIAALKQAQMQFNQGNNYMSEVKQKKQMELRQKEQAFIEAILLKDKDPEDQTNVKIEVAFELLPIYRKGFLRKDKQVAMILKVGEGQLYVVKDYEEFFKAYGHGGIIRFGKNFVYDDWNHEFSEKGKELLQLLKELYQLDLMQRSSLEGSGYRMISGKHVYLSDQSVKRVLEIIEGHQIKIVEKGTKDILARIKEGLPFQVTLSDIEEDIFLKINDFLQLKMLTEDGQIVLYKDMLAVLNENQQHLLKLFRKHCTLEGEILFSGGNRDIFISKVLDRIKSQVEVEIDPKISRKIVKEDLEPKIYVDKVAGKLAVGVQYQYGKIVINALNQIRENYDQDRILKRQVDEEEAIMENIEPYMKELNIRKDRFLISDDELIYAFLYEELPKLENDFGVEVYLEEKAKAYKFKEHLTIRNQLNINHGLNFLEYSFSIDNIGENEIADLVRHVRLKKKYYKAANGLIYHLQEHELKNIMKLAHHLGLEDEALEAGTVEVPMSKAPFVDAYVRETGFTHVKRSSLYKDLISKIGEPEDLEYEVPEAMKVSLRPYQMTGYRWLISVANYGFGCILADDMGLGKTVQTIAFIMHQYDIIKKPSLVVAPTSLVLNWKDEIEKFCPTMKVTVIKGDPIERKDLIRGIDQEQIVLTSYGQLRNDIEIYKTVNFAYCVIDEAQYIKNPSAHVTKSVKSIVAEGKIALTGTPIENNLTELWSLFDFIMPGYLFSHSRFTTKFERPIMRQQKEILIGLKQMIRPFILRRLKQEVLDELPPKIEDTVSVELTEEQKKLYVGYLKKGREEIQVLSQQGIEKSHIKVLALLTRLRQLCCHPALFIEDYQGTSGKIEILKELLKDAIDGGHRLLVFSQFTSMLGLIKGMLEEEGFHYFYLDGSTKPELRRDYVKAFNQGEKQIFLISLKAGGTGLNLTGADMVIHFDPWWNPAVEDQATDRAYRIGQKKTVQVMKLITKGTIEEKIYKLQQKKKALINSVIESGEGFMSKMSVEEIMELFEDDMDS